MLLASDCIQAVVYFQVELVHCLEFGLVSKCALACIRGLTVCALEMQNTMMRLLPSVLLKLSKICATVSMAVPLMEFLSSKESSSFKRCIHVCAYHRILLLLVDQLLSSLFTGRNALGSSELVFLHLDVYAVHLRAFQSCHIFHV